MKGVILGAVMFAVVCLLSIGCGQRPDTDVTSSPEYNFLKFAGTIWKTKVRVALADLKRYTGRHDTAILPPRGFDTTDANYTPVADMQMIAVLAVGTRLRIERLMKDNGVAGLLWVTASLEDGKVVYLSNYLLARNRFVRAGSSDSKEWDVDPDMLEKAD